MPSIGELFVGLAAGGERLLSRGFKYALGEGADAAQRMERLNGRVAALVVRGSGLRLCVQFIDGSISVSRDASKPADVTITGRLAGLAQYARSSRRGEPVAPGQVEINGDVAVAQDMQTLISGLDIAPESWLAGIVGDVAAHRAVRSAEVVGRMVQRSSVQLEQDLGDYLRHELGMIVSRDSVAEFVSEVGRLAAAVERAETRLLALEAKARAR